MVVVSIAVTLLFIIRQQQTQVGEMSQGDRANKSGDATISSSNASQRAPGLASREDRSKATNTSPSLGFLVNDEISDVGQLAELIEIANELWDKEGISALQLVYDTIGDEALRETLMGFILYQAIESGHKEVFNSALELDGSARRWTLHEVVTQWAQIDPQSTVEAVWALDSTDPSLRILQRRTVWEWAKIQPSELLTNMEAVPDNIRDFAQEKALLALAREVPEAAIEYLPNFSGSKREVTVAKEIVKSLTSRNPDLAVEWVNSYRFSNSEQKRQVVETTFRTFAQVAPERAFQAALKQPREFAQGGMESIVIAEVAKTNISQAANLLSEVRDDSQTIYDAYLATAQAMVRSHLEFDRALELGKQLPHWHDDFYHALFIQWRAYHPVQLLDRLERVPLDHRSHAAYSVIVNNTVSLVLDSDQVQKARAYLNEDHLERVDNLPKHHVNTVQFPTHDEVVYSEEELAEIEAKYNAVRNEVKLRRSGDL